MILALHEQFKDSVMSNDIGKVMLMSLLILSETYDSNN